MRDSYVTKKYAKEKMIQLLRMCHDGKLRPLIEERKRMIEIARTTECRKFLLFDTIKRVQNFYQ